MCGRVKGIDKGVVLMRAVVCAGESTGLRETLVISTV
jgi:hypothetical protein